MGSDDLFAEGMTLVAQAERDGRDLTPAEAARYDAIVAQLQGRGRDSPPDGDPQQVAHTAAAAESAASAFSDAGPTPSTKEHAMTVANSRYQQLVDQRATLISEGKNELDAALTAGRNLTAEELTRSNQRKEQVAYLTQQIDALEAQRDMERLVSGQSGGSSRLPLAFDLGPARGGAPPAIAGAPWGHEFGVQLIRMQDGSHKYGGTPNAFDIALGSFLGAVKQAGSPNGSVDPRLYNVNAASGGSTSVPSDGGFMVGTDFSTQLMEMALYESQLAQRCRTIDLGAGTDKLEAPYLKDTSRATGSRWGGVRVYRRAEAKTVANSEPELEDFELELADLMGIAYMTGRQVKDAPSLGQVFREAFTSEFAFVIDDEIFRGTGAGQCLGFATSGNGALVSVSAETGQTADTIIAENIMKMYARMRPRSLNNAVWFINTAVTPQLQQMQIGTGTSGQLVYMPAGGLSGAAFATLYGRPVIPIEQASALGDLGDIVFADLSQYILIRKGAIEEAESMHVRFLYDETAFRWMQRINGRPKDRTAVTPYKGTDTLSPFVALAAR